MEELNLNKFKLLRLRAEKSLVPNKKIYVHDNDLYKIYTFEPKSVFSIVDRETYVDHNQIEFLSSLRKYIKLSHLPKGIIKHRGDDNGVIYDYFKDYKSFTELYLEDKNTIFHNIKCAIEAMNELIMYDIYNSDLIGQNILYKGNSVELIDLDGPYIRSDYGALKDMYHNFLNSIFEIITEKLKTQYSIDDLKEIQVIIKRLLSMNHTYIENISTKQIDEIEKLGLVK